MSEDGACYHGCGAKPAHPGPHHATDCKAYRKPDMVDIARGQARQGIVPRISTVKEACEIALAERRGFFELLELTEELRIYTHNWDWKYGEWWDAEFKRLKALLGPPQDQTTPPAFTGTCRKCGSVWTDGQRPEARGVRHYCTREDLA